MIEIRRITTKDNEYYTYVEELLVASFPVEEYRDLSVFRRYADSLSYFYCNVILDDSTPVGLLSYWELGDFNYIEHLAIDPRRRGGGYGKEVLDTLDKYMNNPIVLEVERPTDETAQRRICFYQRHGFELWTEDYFQPPYRTGHGRLPLYLMVKGGLTADRDFERVRKAIYHTVYGVGV